MIEAVVDHGLGNSSYVVDLGDGGALVVDPERNPAPYRAAMERRGLRPRFVVETHLHADFVSGARQLVAEGATLLAPAGSDLLHGHLPLVDGDEVDLGGLTMEVIATPGHTPEHLAYLLRDGDATMALFSGGTLMAGGVARTDLVSPGLTEPLARAAYRSIRDRLLTLPDDLPVYPTHGAGSFCSAGPTGGRTTTIGRERATNPLLRLPDEDAFVDALLAGLGSYPRYFARMRPLNRAGPEIHAATPPVPALGAIEVRALLEEGAVLVDARPIDRYGADHVPGSISIELRDAFGTWLGWLVDPDRPLLVVVDDDQDLDDLIWQALNVGFPPPAGRLVGGMARWRAEGLPSARIGLVSPHGVDPRRTLLDVRQRAEWDAGHVPGAVHVELGRIPERAADLDDGVVIHCGHGQRAMTAASLLEAAGRRRLTVTTGGPEDLVRAFCGSVAAR